MSRNELNYCVRNGNRWTLTLISTNFMLSGLTGQNGMDISNIVNMFNQFNKGVTDGPPPPFQASGTSEPPNTGTHTESSPDDSFDAAIRNILAEYDMAQAESYTNDISNNNSDQEVFP